MRKDSCRNSGKGSRCSSATRSPSLREWCKRLNCLRSRCATTSNRDSCGARAAPGTCARDRSRAPNWHAWPGPGRRRWRAGKPRNPVLDPAAPLKILRNFRPESEWLLDPGDMLYLPPGWAHEGVALAPCFTYSIGFRAPSHGDTAREFLGFLQDRVAFDGRYADPGLKPQRHPAEIPQKMVQQAAAVAKRIRWHRQDVARFLGESLSAPKPQVVFSRPRSPHSPARFAALCSTRALCLDLRTRMLFRGRDFFVNGERFEPPRHLRARLARLADERVLPPGARLPRPLLQLLHGWYLAGWLRTVDRHE